jgi:hypothetical protein
MLTPQLQTSDLTVVSLMVKFQTRGIKDQQVHTWSLFYKTRAPQPILMNSGALGLQCRPFLKPQCMEELGPPPGGYKRPRVFSKKLEPLNRF